MVVLRMSIIPFYGSLHNISGERIGAVPWSEVSAESLWVARKRVEWTVVLLKRAYVAQDCIESGSRFS